MRFGAVLVLSLALIGQASAARSPTPLERAALIHVTAAHLHLGQGEQVKYVRVRVSSADPRWAIVSVRRWDAGRHQLQSGTFVWLSANRRWTLFDVGDALLGCGVPTAVRKDLGLYCSAAAAKALGSIDTPVLTGCAGQLLLRPPSISFCGDGNFYLTGITWAAWGRFGAVGAAIAHQNDCASFCAGGHYSLYNAAVWLTRPRRCSDGRIQYTRLAYVFLTRSPPRISPGPHVLNAPLAVGAARCP